MQLEARAPHAGSTFKSIRIQFSCCKEVQSTMVSSSALPYQESDRLLPNQDMRLLYHPNPKDIALSGVLYALGDPVRLEIVRRLAIQGELSCAALDCAVPKSTMSHHLKVLREAGVLYCRKEGTQHINSLRWHDLNFLFPGLLEVVLQSVDPAFLQAVQPPQSVLLVR